MSEYVVYEPESGFVYVKGSGAVSGASPSMYSPTAQVLECDFEDTTEVYVENGVIKNKQDFEFIVDKSQILADETDTTKISNIPEGTLVSWRDGQEDIITDGQVELATDFPANYRFIFSHPAYIRKEVIIEAVSET